MAWTVDEARGHIAAFDRSGLPLTTFCERLGVSPQRMYYWRDRLRERRESPSSLPQLVEVAVRPAPQPMAGTIELSFPSGHLLRVPVGVPLHELLRAAGLAAC